METVTIGPTRTGHFRDPAAALVREPAAARRAAQPAGSGSAWPAAGGAAGSAQPGQRIEKGAVTEAAVAAAARAGARLVLGRRAVLTPLARDRARAAGVEIEKER